MLPPGIPHLCAYSAHTKLSAHLQQAAIRLPAVPLVNFALETALAAILERLRVAKVRLILPITPFTTEKHGYQSPCVFRPPLWLCADLHLGCCPQGTTCCGGNACCTPGYACDASDGKCRPIASSTTLSIKATPITPTATTTSSASRPTSSSAAAIRGAVGGIIGGLLLTGVSVAAWYF